MSRRVSTVATQLETKDDTNFRRVSTVAVQLETEAEFNYRRISSVAVQIEYLNQASIQVVGIASEEAFGTPTITTGPATLLPVGIASEEAFGVPEVVGGNRAPVRTSQLDAEALVDPTPGTRITQLSTEAAVVITPATRITQLDTEVAVDPPNLVRITQLSIELLRHSERQTGYTLCAGEELITLLGTPQVVIRVDPQEVASPFSPVARRVAGIKSQVIGTKLASLGLSLLAYKPAISPLVSYNPQGSFIKRLENQVTGWSHSIDITSGYASANMDMQTTREEIEDWLEFGLGRHIMLYNEAGIVIWEGFVNRVEANLGPLTYSTGALIELGNIVNVVYTPVDVTIDPPTRGSTTSTISVADDESILRFGAIEKTLSAGECMDADADQYRDTWMAVNAWPHPTKDISLGKGEFSMSIELLGYAAFLNLVGYENDSIAFTTLSQKLQDVLAADINGMFSTDYTGIAENLYLVPEAEGLSTQRMMWDVVKSLVAIGDVNDARYGFGIYAGRRARYFQIPTNEITYRARLDDPSQSIFNVDMSAIVRPWNIVPGRWLQYTDMLSGKVPPVSLFEDQRSVLIEEVKFSFPWGLDIRGGSASPIAQLVAKMGYNG